MADLTKAVVDIEPAQPEAMGTSAIASAEPDAAPKPAARGHNTYMERCLRIREAYYAGSDEFYCPYEGCTQRLQVRPVPPREHLLTCAIHGRILHCEG